MPPFHERCRSRFAAEALERRTLMAFGPLGGEFHVNTTPARDQFNSEVAADADGDFVIAWTSVGQDVPAETVGLGVYVRRYSAAGVAQGGEITANTTTAGDQFSPAVAMDADGDFVVTWRGNGVGDNVGVFARRFNAAGLPQGDEFRVNNTTAASQVLPTVAIDDSGDFVIAWTSFVTYGQGDVFARRYNAAGVAQGNEFPVNNTTTANNPSAAMDADGDFVIAWESVSPVFGDSYDIFARRYSAAGAAQGDEFGVNTTVAFRQGFPSVAMENGGDFVVTWAGEGQEPDNSYGIYARRYDAAATAQGDEFHVNTHTPGHQAGASVTMDSDGDFVVTWHSPAQDVPAEPMNYGVYGQRYNAAGIAQGNEFRVNTHTPGNQSRVTVAMDDAGEFVVTWTSAGQEVPAEPNNHGVYAQRYGDDVDTAAPRVAAVFVDGAAWTAAFRQFLQTAGMGSATFGFQIPGGATQLDELPWTNVNRVHVRFSEDVTVDNGDLSLRGVNTAGYALNPNAFAYDPATFTATWTLANNVRFANDKIILDLNADAGGANPGVTDKAGPAPNRLDGEWTNGTSAFPSGNGTAGGDFRFQLNVLPGDVNRNGGVVNSLDLQAVRIRQFSSPTNVGTPPNTYTAFHDLDGNAFINSLDVQGVRLRQFSSLPSGNPSLAAATTGGVIHTGGVIRLPGLHALEPLDAAWSPLRRQTGRRADDL